MMSQEMLSLADAVINSLQLDSRQRLSEDTVRKLQAVLPDTTIIAALAIIDGENVLKNTTPWGYIEYEVVGSSATHTVFIDLPMTPFSCYCTCPAFAYAVLGSGNHIMCKHVLATRLAIHFGLCMERTTNLDYIASTMLHQYN